MRGDELNPPILLEDMLEAVDEIHKTLIINRLMLEHEQIRLESESYNEIAQTRISEALKAINRAIRELAKVRKDIEQLKQLRD